MIESRTNDVASKIDAQAAVWFARMRSEERTEADEAGFRDWIAEDPRRGAAFDAMTTNWDFVGGVAGQWRADREGAVAGATHPRRRQD